MTSLLEWLLDLDQIRLARDAPLLLRWENGLPAWLLFGIALLAAAWIAAIYRREPLSQGRRIALGGIRAIVLALVIIVLCQPALVLQRNRIEPAQTVLLVDTSLSMAATEPVELDPALLQHLVAGSGIADPALFGDTSRLGFVQAALTRESGQALKALTAHNAVQVVAFDSKARTIASVQPGTDAAPLVGAVNSLDAEGLASDLGGAIRHVLDKAQGRRIAAIVVASDGQSTEVGSLRDAMDAARGRQVPVYTVRVGLGDRLTDVEIGHVRAQESVFAEDLVSVEGEVRALGAIAPVDVRVELLDERTGSVVAAQDVTLDPGAPARAVELTTKAGAPGRAAFRLRAVPLPGERVVENNSETVSVEVMQDKLRVLYVEGYPRFEYRYLKNALVREKTVELSVLLLEADEQFVQEGTFPIRRFPESPEELGRFHVVLFGDVDPRAGWLTSAQMKMLLDFVGNEGGGFGLIAGERFAPQRFLGTPLEKLIPVRIDSTLLGPYDTIMSSGFRVRLTPEGRRSRIFREEQRGEAAGPSQSVVPALPELYWFARTQGVKPGGTVLAEHPALQSAGDAARGAAPLPLVVFGRYGAGKLFFQATDDTWRWRQHTGELAHDTYWVQAVREIMRPGGLTQDRRLTLQADRRLYDYGERVRLQVEISDAELLAANRESVILTVQQEGQEVESAGRGTPSAGLAQRLTAMRVGPDSRLFEVTTTPPGAGRYRVRVESISPREGEAPASTVFRVEKPDIELRRPEADHETLRRLAEATGGQFVELSAWPDTLAAIPDRSVQIPDDVTEPLWDSKLALLLFVLFLSLEWILRKAFGVL